MPINSLQDLGAPHKNNIQGGRCPLCNADMTQKFGGKKGKSRNTRRWEIPITRKEGNESILVLTTCAEHNELMEDDEVKQWLIDCHAIWSEKDNWKLRSNKNNDEE